MKCLPKKMGRPTNDPKPYKIDARLNAEDFQTLEDYCRRKNIKRPEGIRDAIRELKNKQ